MDRLLVPEGPVWRCGPAFVLLLALAATLLFGPGRRYFYPIRGLEEIRDLGDYNRVEMHNGVRMNHMKVACNLALEHNFLGFYRLRLKRDGKLTYEPYNRFPVGGHVLIKLVTLPSPTTWRPRYVPLGC